MHPRTLIILLLVTGAGAPATLHAQRSDLLPPPRRAAAVELAGKLVEPRDAPALDPKVSNPFAPAGFEPAVAETGPVAGPVAPRERTNREILDAIGASIRPTGTMIMRGEPILLFGSRQARVGDELPVTVNGVAHIVIITAIESTHFTIRLNNEEITRPIQPGSKS